MLSRMCKQSKLHKQSRHTQMKKGEDSADKQKLILVLIMMMIVIVIVMMMIMIIIMMILITTIVIIIMRLITVIIVIVILITLKGAVGDFFFFTISSLPCLQHAFSSCQRTVILNSCAKYWAFITSYISKVPDQNGVSQASYIVEIHPSGQGPSILCVM